MGMRIEKTSLPGVLLITPEVFGDRRGFFKETYSSARYREAGIDCDFCQDNVSYSMRGVLRGMHYQLGTPQAKLVTVFRGAIYDVVVDVRVGSPTFGRWTGHELSETNHSQLFVPGGFAHGFCVTGEEAAVHYKVSALYSPADERGIVWNDPEVGIEWPVENPVVKERDGNYPRLSRMPAADLPRYAGK